MLHKYSMDITAEYTSGLNLLLFLKIYNSFLSGKLNSLIFDLARRGEKALSCLLGLFIFKPYAFSFL